MLARSVSAVRRVVTPRMIHSSAPALGLLKVGPGGHCASKRCTCCARASRFC
jgi:hypothetical protein